MPKHFIKRHMPNPDKIRANKSLRFLGELLHEPNLWHINRHSIARAFFIGLFWCFIPMPFQMVAAAFCAIWFNGNLPISVALVWISNPLTMPPMFYFNYRFGAMLLDRQPLPYEFHLSVEWISERLLEIGVPLYLGSLVLGVLSACIAYLVVQYTWRRHVRKVWHERQLLRKQRAADSPS
ncbi:DUF2062 domain-containing protein [Marinobacteraceae bacterium S3BR75-40.1]